MKNLELNSVEAVEREIAKLFAIKRTMLDGMLLINKVKSHNWVITDNCYYQYVGVNGDIVSLSRHGEITRLHVSTFNRSFRLATKADVEQHINYLNSKGRKYLPQMHDAFETTPKSDGASTQCYQDQIKKINNIKYGASVPAYDSMGNATKPKDDLPDFYMVTVKGLTGTKFRHDTYEQAEKEAMRLAKSENHRAHIMGVVAIVEPIVEFQVKRR